MKQDQDYPCYPTNWSVRFLCDSKACIHKHDEVCIHQGIAQKISARHMHLLSNHQICPRKNIAMHLTIPSASNDAPQKVLKIIGHSTSTRKSANGFLTEIDFTHFNQEEQQELENNLRQHARPQSSAYVALAA